MVARAIYELDAFIEKLKSIRETFDEKNSDKDLVISVGKVGSIRKTFLPKNRSTNPFDEPVKKVSPKIFFPSVEFENGKTVSDLGKGDVRLMGSLIIPRKILSDDAKVWKKEEVKEGLEEDSE